MDATSITSSIFALHNDIDATEKSIAIAKTQPSFGRSYKKMLEELGKEVHAFKGIVTTVQQTVEVNRQNLKTNAGITAGHAEVVQKCIGRFHAIVNELARHTQNLAAGQPGTSFLASLPKSVRVEEEIGAVRVFRDRMLTYQRELGVILCLLNLWVDLERKASASEIGHLLAALQKHTSILDADIKATEKGQPAFQSTTGLSRALSTVGKSVYSTVMARDVNAAQIARSNGPSRISALLKFIKHK